MTPFLDQKTWIDKTEWGDGPWQDEPDRAYWLDTTTGYPCLARRSENSGIWSLGVYAPLVQVVREVEHLAEQLWRLENERQARNAARRAKVRAAQAEARHLSGVRN